MVHKETGSAKDWVTYVIVEIGHTYPQYTQYSNE